MSNTLGIDIDNNEITPDINLPTIYFTALCNCLT